MQYNTKWGEFIGTEEEYKAFEAEMKRRENPVADKPKKKAPAKKTAPKDQADE